MSFVEPEDIQTVVEGAYAPKVFKAVKNIDIQLPLPRMTWRQAMDEYGSDKPDTRFGMKLQGSGQSVRERLRRVVDHRRKRARPERQGRVRTSSRKEIDALGELRESVSRERSCWLALAPTGRWSRWPSTSRTSRLEALKRTMNAKPGDALFFAADRPNVACTALGQVRMRLGRKFDLIDQTREVQPPLGDRVPAARVRRRGGPLSSPCTTPSPAPMEEVPATNMDTATRRRVRARGVRSACINGIELGAGSVDPPLPSRSSARRCSASSGFRPRRRQQRFGLGTCSTPSSTARRRTADSPSASTAS